MWYRSWGQVNPHSAAENRRIGSGDDAKDLGLALLAHRGANSSSGSLATSPSPSSYTQHPRNAFEPRSPLPQRMGSLRGGGSASAALPVHARFTDTSPRTAPKSLLPTIPEDAPHPDLAPPRSSARRDPALSAPLVTDPGQGCMIMYISGYSPA